MIVSLLRGVSSWQNEFSNFGKCRKDSSAYYKKILKIIFMIKGVHTMFYSSDPTGAREFFRDKVGLKATDVGGGWLIFDIPSADFGIHPAGEESKEGAPSGTAHISFFCDDIYKTVEEMKSKGVQFKMEIEDHGYGFVTQFLVPGGFEVQLYQPKYMKN